jgi:sigma-B regulation protein RsbU (phosphoserine phosphatase)
MEKQILQCMDIWGGNQSMAGVVSLPGMDAWIVSRPYAESIDGGDIYFLSLCGGAKIARMIVADVSGHGGDVAPVAVKLRALMRKHINRPDQTRFVKAVNDEFTSGQSEGRFATAVLGTYVTKTGHLILCNAGHPAPLWRRASTGAWQRLKPDVPERLGEVSNLPLGVVAPTSYEQFAVRLQVGDRVLIYTDGLTEVTDPAGHMLGDDRFLELVRAIDADLPNTFALRLFEAVDEFRAGRAQGDDVTLLMLHYHGVGRRPSVREQVTAVGRTLGFMRT